jgi:hypothetical protein
MGQHKIQISMPEVGFEPTIPAFERTKTVHVLDRTATVIGLKISQDMAVFVAVVCGKMF